MAMTSAVLLGWVGCVPADEGAGNEGQANRPERSDDQPITDAVEHLQAAEWNIELPEISPWVTVSSGTFTVGCVPSRDVDDASQCEQDELPAHEVQISSAFEIMRFEVTRELYEQVMGYDPSDGRDGCDDPRCPVGMLSWFDTLFFANSLSEMDGLLPVYEITGSGDDMLAVWDRAADGYRLPTEAEWRYAARAGESTAFAGSDDILEVGWTLENSVGGPHPVGLLAPNALGLYDMTGNHWEWVWDWSHAGWVYTTTTEFDPIGPSSGHARRDCGGAYNDTAWNNALARRNNTPAWADSHYAPMGVRLVRTLDGR